MSASTRDAMPLSGIRSLLGVTLIAAVSVAAAGEANAQPARPVRIGALTEAWGPTPAIVGLRDGLQELGWRENADFVVGVRFTQGNVAELPEAAAMLVRRGVDVIVATSTVAALAAKTATARIPIVFMGASDPVENGLVKSFPRPGGNITGVADLELDLVPKRLELFRELVPSLKRVLFVYDAAASDAATRLDVHRAAARRLGVTLVERPVQSEEDARAALTALRKTEVDGVLAPRASTFNIPGLILDIAPKRGIATMFHDVIFVEQGGFASYAPSSHEIGRQAARLVERIVKGVKPADVPVEQPTKLHLVLNLKAAKSLGIPVPSSIVLRADRLIE